MELRRSGYTLDITGNIKTMQDFESIKDEVNAILSTGVKEVKINIIDSISITSSVIGYLVKIVKLNDIRLIVNVKDEDLYELLSDLDLLSLFNVHKI